MSFIDDPSHKLPIFTIIITIIYQLFTIYSFITTYYFIVLLFATNKEDEVEDFSWVETIPMN